MKSLIVVDTQVDFTPGGSLPVEGGDIVAAKISTWITDHFNDYKRILATKDYHYDPGDHFSDQPDYINTWPPHCVQGTPGAEFHPNLNPEFFHETFRKGAIAAAYSGFQGKNWESVFLHEYLKRENIDELDIVGIATDHCIRATALDAIKLKYKTNLLLGLCAGVAPDTTEKALIEMREARVNVLTT